MRLVHTSDWHLGRRLDDWSLLDDQAEALDQIFRVCKDERADALVVAGDLYDRAIPPIEAVELLSDFVERLVADLGIPFVAISGNHDSPERLGFSADVLARGKVHIRTALEARILPVTVDARRQRVHLFCLPYLEPEAARHRLHDPTLASHDAAVEAALVAMRAQRDLLSEPSILVAHLFAQGGVESVDSERPLVVGGAAAVAASALAGWSYVALGHLHRPQRVGGREDVRYSGSPLAYSFDEQQGKSVSLVEFVLGRATVRPVALTPRHPLIKLEATFDELLTDPRFAGAEDAFVEATYTDTGYVVDAAPRLRQRFERLCRVVPREIVRQAADDERRLVVPSSPRDARALLGGFWRYVEDDAPDDEALAAFEKELGACARAS